MKALGWGYLIAAIIALAIDGDPIGVSVFIIMGTIWFAADRIVSEIKDQRK